MQVLVTGASGYIGGRLVGELLAAGHQVRCLARTPGKLVAHAWADDQDVAIVQGDLLDRDSLGPAVDGIDAVYYLVHSMDGEGAFADRDLNAARNLRESAEAAGVQQIIYLGGMGEEEDDLSEHLRSRHEVGRELGAGAVPLTELRAAVIIGSGSASFEMLRHLTDVLPVMTTPTWVSTRCQPIAIRDVLFHLVAVLGNEDALGRTFDIGGPDVMTYADMMHLYAEVAGLRRRVIIPVPVLSPTLSSRWVGLVTPLPTGLARPLVASLVNEVVVRQPIDGVVDRDCLTMREAFELALARVQDLAVPTTWAGAELGRIGIRTPVAHGVEHAGDADPDWAGGTVLSDDQDVRTTASAEALYATVTGIGGDRGYYAADVLWEVRGLLDSVIGGIGLRRGRRHPDDLGVGDALDFWRVETMEEDHLLRLHAEMKLPGQAWLEFHIEDRGDHRVLSQHARFVPRGLWGRAYWVSMLPFHAFIFPVMAKRLVAAAEQWSPSVGSVPAATG